MPEFVGLGQVDLRGSVWPAAVEPPPVSVGAFSYLGLGAELR